ncbi:MAG: acyloxyacyl hydrolase [Thermoanaerobaculia bacterium]
MKTGFLVLLLAGCGVSTFSLAQEAPPRTHRSYSVLGIAGQNVTWAADHGFSEFGGVTIEAEQFVSRRLAIGLDLHPYMLISQPETDAGDGRENVSAAALDILIRYEIVPPSPRLRAYAEIAGGPFYALSRTPPAGSRFNFFTELGTGIELPIGTRWWGVAGYRWVHISNAGTSGRNPSWNFHTLVLGARFHVSR